VADSIDDLYRRFRKGDEDAFRALVNRHTGLVLKHLSGRVPAHLRRRIALSDVVQETCVVAFRRRADFEDRGTAAFGNWVVGIAENKLREEVRRHARASMRSADREVSRAERPDTAYFVGPYPSPSHVADSAERVARVRAAMAELPQDYRAVLTLALEQGLSLREAAEHLGRSRDATKKLYGRALHRLRQLLGEEVDGGP
jgi:RNA polymerase sigma-70 factor (subfamily 1)